MTTEAVHRPIGVAVVAIIAFIQAIFAVLGGLALIVERNNNELLTHVDNSSNTVTTYGVLAIIWGVVAFFVAWGLWHGANWARIVIGILEVLHIAGGVYLLFAWSGTYIWEGIWQIVVALIVLYFLFGARGEAFFTQRREV